jgi:hypothetical protein
MQSLEVQIGGNHYHQFKKQPIELIAECDWNFVQGNIAKYALRFPFKNGKQDIEKAMHYTDLGADLHSNIRPSSIHTEAINYFVRANNLDEVTRSLLFSIDKMDWGKCQKLLRMLLDKHYPQEK